MPDSALQAARRDRATARPIRLLIVDDSAVARAVLERIIGSRAEFEVAATLPCADAALDFLDRNRVDIILLDIEMPGTDGLTALPALLAASHGARVLVVSSSAAEGAAATMRALTLGAADTLAKPGAGAFGGVFSSALAEKLIRLGYAPSPAARASAAQAPPAPPILLRPLQSGPIACLAIGASTGGLHALSDLLRGLPASFDPPILITQHLPPVFMPFFAAQIEEIARRPTSVARDGARLQKGRIVVAPGEGHLTIVMAGSIPRIQLTDARAESGCMPSVDPMLTSVGAAFGAAAVGVVLSGMGRDGVRGGAALAAAGGEILVQSRDSSVVWGMPGAAAAAGIASAVLPPAQIADVIRRRQAGAA